VGQWQKIALARAFFRDASWVVLDEPTSSLDPLAEAELFQRFRKLMEGRSAILVSHRFSTVHAADRIYVMHAGRIVEHGTHRELLQRGGHYARLYRAQAEHFQL
jgi:ATP-binding cassette subfamily B protein